MRRFAPKTGRDDWIRWPRSSEYPFTAFIDVLGFRSAVEHATGTGNSGDLIFNLWRNAFLQARGKLRFNFTSAETADYILNFVQMSDSLFIYGDDPSRVVDLACDVFGGALAWGVPVRGGLGYGQVYHLEDDERPGTAITLYGQGLNDAYAVEQAGKNQGMRLFVSSAFLPHLQTDKGALLINNGGVKEYPWWNDCGVPHAQFSERTSSWWKNKNVGKWFSGVHCDDTKTVFATALTELDKPNK